MPFNQGVKRLIVIDKSTGKHRPCVKCGKTYPLPDAVHIIDQKEWKKASIKGHDRTTAFHLEYRSQEAGERVKKIIEDTLRSLSLLVFVPESCPYPV